MNVVIWQKKVYLSNSSSIREVAPPYDCILVSDGSAIHDLGFIFWEFFTKFLQYLLIFQSMYLYILSQCHIIGKLFDNFSTSNMAKSLQNSCFNPYFWLISSWKSNFYVRDSSLIHILTTSSISVDRSIYVYVLVVYYIKLFQKLERVPSNIIKYIQRVRVFPVVWQCIAVGMVLFSVVNTMFMPEWGLNCCGSTQSIIAPIYFFREFDTNFWIVPTPEYYICHLYYDLIRKKERRKKERKNGLRF